MDYKEAKERLDEFGYYCDNYCDGVCKKCSDQKDRILEALEKQIPKKLATNGENFGGMLYKFCPSCGHCMGLKPKASYCSECGQRIDCEVE